MANVVKSYIFPPQWNFEYAGAICLGNIIYDLKNPQYSLNEDNQEPLPRFIVDHRKPQFKAKIMVDSKQSTGLGTSLLTLFGFDVGVRAERSKNLEYVVEAEQLLTQEINPLPSYVKACFEHEEVAEYLKDTNYRKDLYMITGIMAARSAMVSSDVGRKHLFEGKAGFNLAPAGNPVGIDAHASTSSGQVVQASFGKSDFILGYRLRKITWSKKGFKKMEDERQGVVLEDGEEPEAAATRYEADIIRLEEGEIGSAEFELPSVTAQNEGTGETFEFVLPKDEDD
jgi:hypothetical protein